MRVFGCRWWDTMVVLRFKVGHKAVPGRLHCFTDGFIGR